MPGTIAVIAALVSVVVLFAFMRLLRRGPLQGSLRRTGEPDVLCVDDNSPEMAEAARMARNSVSCLFDRIPELLEAGSVVSVKIPLETAGGTEHIWVSARTFADGKFHGVLDNVPAQAHGMSLGDPVSIAPNDISDWMVFLNGQIYGGFSLHVLRALSSGRQRRAMDEQFGEALPEQPAFLPQPGL